jgi:hypothetical protein
MTNIYNNDILTVQSNDSIYINLECGYGQPSVTTIYLKKNDVTSVLKTFDNNVTNLEIGKVANLQYNTIEIHTTINDVNDDAVEMTDISLSITVFDTVSNTVSASFTKKTTGKGEIFQSFYTITIL